jgi:hypothetical protein
MDARGTSLQARFSRPEILVITASAISMLIVQMDWFALNLALPDKGEAWGWRSLATAGTLVGGALLLAAFVAIESRVRSPFIDGRGGFRRTRDRHGPSGRRRACVPGWGRPAGVRSAVPAPV